MVKQKTQHKKKNEGLTKLINDHEEGIGYTFLGIGIIMFVLNLSQLLTLLQHVKGWVPTAESVAWMAGGNISLIASIILIVLAVYFLHEHKRK